MTDRGRDDAAPQYIDISPEQSKHRGRDHGIPSLQAVAGPEHETVHDDSQPCTAQVLVEAMDDEGALDLFAKPTGDCGHQREGDRLTARGDQLLEGILRNVMQ